LKSASPARGSFWPITPQFYLTGKTAATGKSATRLYVIGCHSHRPGSFILELSVNLLANGIWDMAKYAFGDFVRDSLGAFFANRAFEEPPVPRIEPHFSPTDKRNIPVFDFSRDHKDEAARLRQRITQALALMATPIGRSADNLRIYINQVELAVIDRARKLEMIQAIEEFCRERGQSLQPDYSWS
jgi:hypothetical protein